MLYLFSFLIGAACGSFINVLVYRLNPEKEIAKTAVQEISGRSYCDACKKTLRWFELIPILSYLIQRGKCWRCKTKIAFEYFLIELISGAVFTLIFWRLNHFLFFKTLSGSWIFFAILIFWWLVTVTILAVCVFDFKYYLIPDFLLYALTGLGVMIQVFYFFVFDYLLKIGLPNQLFFSGELHYLFGSLNRFLSLGIGILVALFVFGLAYFLSFGRGMGLGDVFLAFGLALILGWPDILVLIFLSFLIGSSLSLFLIFFKRKGMKDIVPFAPFLGLGLLVLFLFGDKIVQAYLNLFPGLFL